MEYQKLLKYELNKSEEEIANQFKMLDTLTISPLIR